MKDKKTSSANEPSGAMDTDNEAPEQDNNDSEEGNYAGGSVGGSGLNQDPNDKKAMAVSPNDKPGREIIASLATLNDNRNSPIKSYYEFPSSKNDVYDTYPTRMEKISELLGNKDEVRG